MIRRALPQRAPAAAALRALGATALGAIALGAVLGAASLACAGGFGGGNRAAPAAVERGAPLEGVLASLSGRVDEDTSVSRDVLQLLRMDAPPYPGIARDDAYIDRGPVGAVAERTCHTKDGWRRRRVPRASWYLFDNGRLVAFEHTEFDAGCAARRRYAPTPDDREAERALARDVARRYPDSLPDAADQLRLGIALLAVDRVDESRLWLKKGERALRRAELDVEKAISDEERTEATARRDELRQLRDTLRYGLERRDRAERGDAEPGIDLDSLPGIGDDGLPGIESLERGRPGG